MMMGMAGRMKRKGGIRKNKGILAWMLTIVLLVLAGCGGQSGNGGNAAGGEDLAAESESRTDTAAAESESQTDAAEAAPESQNDAEMAAENQAETAEHSTEKEVDGVRREEAGAGSEATAKKLSILGDSISTFDGWIPEGYACFFPMSGDVPDVEQTWWKMVLKDMDMELCVNGSSSGSTCIGDSFSVDEFKYGCSECRIGELIGGSGSFPDIIIVYMGTNDLLKAVPLGENDGTQTVEEGMIENFSDAYCMILDKLIAYYPNAEIYCCNLPPIGDWGPESGPAFVPFVNSLELTSEDYGRQIEAIAAAKGCKIIDLQNCGITVENMAEYVTDGVHMNAEGMKLIRDAVEGSLLP